MEGLENKTDLLGPIRGEIRALLKRSSAILQRARARMIERAQKKVEEHYFESRKHVLQYDDVMNKQREVIYGERRRILEGADLRDTILGFLRQTIADSVEVFCPESEIIVRPSPARFDSRDGTA